MQIVILEFSSANGSKIPIDGPRRYLALSEEIRISLARSKKSQCKKIQILKGIQMMKKYLSELDRVQEVSKTFKSHYVSSIQVSDGVVFPFAFQS